MSSTEKGKTILKNKGMFILYRPVRSLLFVTIFFFLVGCASDAKKASPVLSQATDLREVVQEMAKAYARKDGRRFFEKLDPSFHPMERFKNKVDRDFKGFSKADIQMTIEQIRIEQESFVTVVRWRGDWIPVSGGPALRKRGHAVFRWTSKPMLRLLEVKGNPPFGVF